MEHRADADALALVRRFVARCHPDAEAGLLAGSRSRGRGAPGSDYDVILLFGELPNGAWGNRERLRSRSSRPSRTIAARSAIFAAR